MGEDAAHRTHHRGPGRHQQPQLEQRLRHPHRVAEDGLAPVVGPRDQIKAALVVVGKVVGDHRLSLAAQHQHGVVDVLQAEGFVLHGAYLGAAEGATLAFQLQQEGHRRRQKAEVVQKANEKGRLVPEVLVDDRLPAADGLGKGVVQRAADRLIQSVLFLLAGGLGQVGKARDADHGVVLVPAQQLVQHTALAVLFGVQDQQAHVRHPEGAVQIDAQGDALDVPDLVLGLFQLGGQGAVAAALAAGLHLVPQRGKPGAVDGRGGEPRVEQLHQLDVHLQIAHRGQTALHRGGGAVQHLAHLGGVPQHGQGVLDERPQVLAGHQVGHHVQPPGQHLGVGGVKLFQPQVGQAPPALPPDRHHLVDLQRVEKAAVGQRGPAGRLVRRIQQAEALPSALCLVWHGCSPPLFWIQAY